MEKPLLIKTNLSFIIFPTFQAWPIGLDCICRRWEAEYVSVNTRVLVLIWLWHQLNMHISEWLAELITWSCQALKNTWLTTFNLAFEWTCNFNEHSWGDKVMVGCLLQTFSFMSCSAFLAQCCSQTKFMKSTQGNDPLKVIFLLLVACHPLLHSFFQLLLKVF